MDDTTNTAQPMTCEVCANCAPEDRCDKCGGCKRMKAMTDEEKAAGGCMCGPCTCLDESAQMAA